jgi:hypothetical protein
VTQNSAGCWRGFRVNYVTDLIASRKTYRRLR